MNARVAILAAAALAAIAGACAPGAGGEHGRAAAIRADATARRHVYLVIVDGLDAREVAAGDTPALAGLQRESGWCEAARSRAAMPTRTNVNHATLVTGVHPDVHGVTGNVAWDRAARAVRKLGGAADLLTETLFTVAARERPELRTAAIVGKHKLALMFAASAGRQMGPGRLWDPREAASAGLDAASGYALDRTTLSALRDIVTRDPVDFAIVNLAEVDLVSHRAGPHSPAASAARRETDAALADFIGYLRGRPEWVRTTVVVTSDHGFDTVEHAPLVLEPAMRAAGLSDLVSVGDGGVAHVYLERADDSGATARLTAARRLALTTPGIAEALYLAPNALDGGGAHTLATVHPDWHLVHERSGDLLLVGASGYVLADADPDAGGLKGSHGAPGERAVPLIVVSGSPPGPVQDCDGIEAADVGRTLIHCVGLRDVERLDGGPIAPEGRGRLLRGLCR